LILNRISMHLNLHIVLQVCLLWNINHKYILFGYNPHYCNEILYWKTDISASDMTLVYYASMRLQERHYHLHVAAAFWNVSLYCLFIISLSALSVKKNISVFLVIDYFSKMCLWSNSNHCYKWWCISEVCT